MENQASIQILHLSDIHVDSEKHFTLARIDKIAGAIQSQLPQVPSIVLVTGDIAYGGEAKEYEALTPNFKKLENDLYSLTNSPVTWIMVPGNHDGTFKNSSKNRAYTLAGILKDGEIGIDESTIKTCTEPQRDYFTFRDNFEKTGDLIFEDELLSIHELIVDNKKIHFWAMNASWMSQVPEQPGNLVYPIKRYQEQIRKSADYRIAVIHHPLNWYAQNTYHSLREFLFTHFCVVISGHEHVATNHTVLPSQGSDTHMISAGALGPHKRTDPSIMSVINLSINGNASITQHHFTWSEALSTFKLDVKQTASKTLALHRSRNFEPTDELKEKLEDLGAPFSHPTQERLRLSDLYIDPFFKELNQTSDFEQKIAGFSLLESPLGRVILHGDDHSGKTSFLNRFHVKSLESGYIPLLVTARDISNGSIVDREGKISELVRTQYGERAVEPYSITGKDKRLLIIDDLDSLLANADAYVRTLQFLKQHTENCLITVNERFDISVLGSTLVSELFLDYRQYQFLGFSYVMRSQLIENWYGLDRSMASADFQRKVHEAQGYLDAAIGKALVPSTPFNTLLILQALETTQKSQVVDAGIAQHYDLLLRRRLIDTGAAAKLHDGLYAYLAHLSWWMREEKTHEIDKSQLESFNSKFSSLIYPVDLSTQLDILVRSRIITSTDGLYKFKYPSSRYFFLAHYITENVEDNPTLRGFVEHACRHLYVTENANLVVFLTSKVASKWIVREVISVMKALLNNLAPLNVISDAQHLNGWINSTARLAVDAETDNRKNRQEDRKREEEAANEESKRTENDEVEDVTKLDVFSQLNLVFKTGEILGIILKGRFGSLETGLKVKLLKELFDGPLRAISFFIGTINEQPDALVHALANFWETKLPKLTNAQRQELAKKFIFNAIGSYSLALLNRQGSMIGSPQLAHAFTALQNEVTSLETKGERPPGSILTYRLVSVAARLSYPGDVPFGDIERLAKEFKQNAFAHHLLQGLVATHLYMFPLKFDNKQRLAKSVSIDLKAQVIKDGVKSDEKSTRKFSYQNPKSLIQRLSHSFLTRNKDVMQRFISKKNSESD